MPVEIEEPLHVQLAKKELDFISRLQHMHLRGNLRERPVESMCLKVHGEDGYGESA